MPQYTADRGWHLSFKQEIQMTKRKTSKSEETTVVSPTERTSDGLRTILFEELDGLRRGTITSTRANAVAKIAMTIVETVKMEIEVQRHANKERIDGAVTKPSLPPPLDLVKEKK
jgi:hypothetical protein